jgi:hypothetical protein
MSKILELADAYACTYKPFGEPNECRADLAAAVAAMEKELDVLSKHAGLLEKENEALTGERDFATQNCDLYFNDALTLRAENERLKDTLQFVERWAVHHGTKPHMTAEQALSCIQHHPAITAITKSYADGKVPDTHNPYAEVERLTAQLDNAQKWIAATGTGVERDRLMAENERLRDLAREAANAMEDLRVGGTAPEIIKDIRAVLAQSALNRRCPLCNYQHGHAIGCKNNPVDIALSEDAARAALGEGK